MPALEPTLVPAIRLANLSKVYGARYGARSPSAGDSAAVSDVNLSVPAGEVIGFLGPNGAGKTTTIRLLLGFLRPSAGSVHLLGHDMAVPHAALEARSRLGFVPDVAGLDPAATGLWLLDELARLQRCPAVDRPQLLDALELRPQDLRRPMGRLSRGTRQKINIVQGLQHRPDLIILDEPTEGLDPLAKRALFDLLHAAHGRGATIFFSSHVLGEVEALCDRVALIRSGRLVAVDRIDDLRAHLQRRVTVRIDGDPAAVARQLASLPAIGKLTHSEGRWHFLTGDPLAALRLLATLPVADIAIEPPSLEDVFLQYYRPPVKPGGQQDA
jgi:ABC-2 type transport system ATP-binding protein